MTKIDIFSGFLGAGKTTLIRKLLDDGYKGEKIVLIENEFGEIGIDRGFLSDAGIEITEMDAGCICCTLVGDFTEAMKKVVEEYAPDRILIEPSGVGKLSDVAKATADVADTVISGMITVVDPRKTKMYMENYGEFYEDQIDAAGTIVFSHADAVSADVLKEALGIIREHNSEATVITTGWDSLTGKQIISEFKVGHEFEHPADCECGCHDHEHHHDHDHDHHHHDHDHGHCDHDHHEHDHHHHHDHDHDHCDHDHHEHDHHHHHDHDHGHHHDHHHADEIFDSIGIETVDRYTVAQLEQVLKGFESQPNILRSKGMVQDEAGNWIFFDYVPGTIDVREGKAQISGKIVVIGTDLDKEAIKKAFEA